MPVRTEKSEFDRENPSSIGKKPILNGKLQN